MTTMTVRCVALFLVSGVLVACGADKASSGPSPTTGVASNTAVVITKTAAPAPSAVTSAVGTSVLAPAQPAMKVRAVTVSGIQLDKAVAAACKVDEPKAYFEYDSAVVKGADMGALDGLAECLGKGALKGKAIEVVGHTDERGDAEYNKALGHSRAQSVADYLGTKGADKTKLKVVSGGAEQAGAVKAAPAVAKGGASAAASAKVADDQALASDRRVDVRLAK